MPRILPQLRAIHQDGFYFSSGWFLGDKDAANRIYPAIYGNIDEDSASTLKQRAKDSLITIFRACIKFSGLYAADRGGRLAWELIAQHAILYADLTAGDVKTVVDGMVAARRNYHGQARPTRLTSLVDSFISVDEDMRKLGPITTTTLTINPVGATLTDSDVDSLARTLRGAGLSAAWPPNYFTTGDLISLADSRVQEVLGPIHSGTSGNNVAYPSFVSIPIDLQIFLCHLGLLHYRPDKSWALSLSAVGFFNNVHRQDWYKVMGRQCKVLWTMDRFLEGARDAFTTQGKEFFVGVFVHWLHKAENIERRIDVTQTDPLQIWAEHRGLRRYGTVMILRRVNGKLQVIWYDPWLHNPAVKEPYMTRQTEIYEYRNRVVTKIQIWAQGVGVPIHSRYWGGIGTGIGGHDSVTMSMKWLENLISAPAGMGAMFPDPHDEREFRRKGFIKTDEE